jgi:homoserine kinase
VAPPTSVTVRVPATTANLGPGFDCLGLALDLWNQATFTLGGDGVHVEVRGEGADVLPRDESNLVAQAARRGFDERGAPPAGLRISCDAQVPLASGLGSSSSAVVAGLLAADALLGRPFDRDRLLVMAADMEGHPDNVAAALLGGLVIVVRRHDRLLSRRIDTPELHMALAVPAMSFSTSVARAGLPTEVTLSDAVYNLGRTPLVVEALRMGDLELLGLVMDDRLHQRARLKLVPGADVAWMAAREAGAAAVAVSGSGPSLIAFASLHTDAVEIAGAMVDAFAGAGVTARPLALTASSECATVLP